MEQNQKKQIVDDALAYMAKQGMSQNQLALHTGINPGYLSNMLRGIFQVKAANNHFVDIDPKWFYLLNEKIGGEFEKSYWETVATPEFIQMINALESFKKTGRSGMIIGATGIGKTFVCEKFATKNPMHTYKVTVNELQRLGDILNELLQQMGSDTGGNNTSRLEKVIQKIRWQRRNGGKPIIILDEFENAKAPLIKTIKALYDGVRDYGSVVLIGTDQLPTRINRLRAQNRDGMPQFCRRFKAGTKYLESSQRKNFNPILDKLNIVDKGLRKLLYDICENYGELNDYLEPALREADHEGVALTEDYFRLLYNMPKY